MVRITRRVGEAEVGSYGLGEARAVVDRHVGTWFSVAWKFALVYALWISLAYVAMTNLTSTEARQIAAIGFWFGWLFLGLTVALGVVVTLGGLVDQFRLSRSKRKF